MFEIAGSCVVSGSDPSAGGSVRAAFSLFRVRLSVEDSFDLCFFVSGKEGREERT